MPKDQLEKAASFAAPRNQQNNLQAARAQKSVSRTQSAPVLTDNRWRTERLPFYSYRDVAYAIEGPDKITRTPQRIYVVTEEDADKWVSKLTGCGVFWKSAATSDSDLLCRVIGFDMEWPYDPKTKISGKTSMVSPCL